MFDMIISDVCGVPLPTTAQVGFEPPTDSFRVSVKVPPRFLAPLHLDIGLWRMGCRLVQLFRPAESMI